MKEPTVDKKSYTKETLKIFWQHTRRYFWLATTSVALMYLQSSIDIVRPWIYKDLLNLFVDPNKPAEKAWQLVALLVGLSLTGIIVKRVSTWFVNKFQSQVKRDLWLTAFNAIHKRSYSYLINQFVGSLVKKANRYDSAYERISDEMLFGFGQTIYRVAATIVAIAIFRKEFALIFLVWILIYVVFIVWTLRWKREKDLAKAASDSKTSGLLADSVGNYHTVKIFASWKYEAKKFELQLKEYIKNLMAVWNASLAIDSGQAVMGFLLELAVFSMAIKLWLAGQFTVGDMGLVQLYVSQLSGRLWDLGRQIRGTTQALADANEMTEIILEQDWQEELKGTKPFQENGSIVFHDVSFSYGEGTHVIRHFNLEIPKKQRLALVGPSGGGKTTLTKILLRLHPISKGDITVANQSLYATSVQSLREHISYVPQEPILFHRSLYENIAYGKSNSSKEEVIKAAKLARAHDFISKLKDGYDTLVGERGIKLSGGERQRVAIARAILKDAPILVLDEATSSLDSESEMLIQDALKYLMKNKTVIVIAHRLSTIMQMDRIIVLENGTITEDGKHKELIKAKQGTYQKLWGIQAGSFS